MGLEQQDDISIIEDFPVELTQKANTIAENVLRKGRTCIIVHKDKGTSEIESFLAMNGVTDRNVGIIFHVNEKLDANGVETARTVTVLTGVKGAYRTKAMRFKLVREGEGLEMSEVVMTSDENLQVTDLPDGVAAKLPEQGGSNTNSYNNDNPPPSEVLIIMSSELQSAEKNVLTYKRDPIDRPAPVR